MFEENEGAVDGVGEEGKGWIRVPGGKERVDEYGGCNNEEEIE